MAATGRRPVIGDKSYGVPYAHVGFLAHFKALLQPILILREIIPVPVQANLHVNVPLRSLTRRTRGGKAQLCTCTMCIHM